MPLVTMKLILGLLSLASTLATWLRNKQQIDAGYDKAIAQAATEILFTTEAGKKLRDQVRSVTDEDADKLWKDMLNA